MLLVVIRVNFVLVIEIANDRKLKDCYCMKVASWGRWRLQVRKMKISGMDLRWWRLQVEEDEGKIHQGLNWSISNFPNVPTQHSVNVRLFFLTLGLTWMTFATFRDREIHFRSWGTNLKAADTFRDQLGYLPHFIAWLLFKIFNNASGIINCHNLKSHLFIQTLTCKACPCISPCLLICLSLVNARKK